MVRRSLLLVALVLGLAAPHAGAARAAENGEFSLRPDRPSSASARDRSYIVRTVAPGDEVADRVLAVNLTDKPIELDVAPVDATVTADGVFAPGTTAAAEGGWLTVTPRRVRVPARGTTRVEVRMRIPHDAAAGDHIAAVVAHRADQAESSGNVRLVQRVGVRVYLTVQPTGESSRVGTLERRFELRDLRWTGTRFEVEVANTGDLLVEPLGTLTITRGGLSATTDVAVLGTVPPHEARTFGLDPPTRLEPGTYDARLQLRLVQGGGDQERSVRFTLDGPLKAAGEGDEDGRDTRRSFPWLFALLAVAALAAVGVEARRRLAA